MSPVENKKVVLITGCSSGFGLLIAARLSATGHSVYATMRNLDKKQDLLDEVARRGSEVSVLQLDVTNTESIRTAVDTVKSQSGRIDVVVNNAGYGIGGFFEDLKEAEIRSQLETNFFGVQNVIREVVPLMRQHHSGLILNLSSMAGFYGMPAIGAYNASKWALEGFSESLYYELKPFGIHVSLIEPGLYKTKIFNENGRYAENFHNQQSPYYQASQFLFKRTMEHVDSDKKSPEDIAILAEKLINSPNPPLRNIPDTKSRILSILKRLLPFRVFSGMIEETFCKEITREK